MPARGRCAPCWAGLPARSGLPAHWVATLLPVLGAAPAARGQAALFADREQDPLAPVPGGPGRCPPQTSGRNSLRSQLLPYAAGSPTGCRRTGAVGPQAPTSRYARSCGVLAPPPLAARRGPTAPRPPVPRGSCQGPWGVATSL